MKQSKNVRSQLEIQESSSRPVLRDTSPHEIISTLHLVTDGLLSNRCREGKRYEGLILVVPIFAPTREEGAQDKGLSVSFLEISSSSLPSSLPLPLSPHFFFPFLLSPSFSPYLLSANIYELCILHQALYYRVWEHNVQKKLTVFSLKA